MKRMLHEEEKRYIKQIFDFFQYHNKNLTKKQYFMIEDLKTLIEQSGIIEG